jgi:hypothetical protein
MANRFWVGGTGTWNNTTTNWSASSGGAGGASVPTINDSVFFDNNSGGSGFIVTCDTNFNPSISEIKFTRTALPMVFRLHNTDNSNPHVLTIQNSWTNDSGLLLTCDVTFPTSGFEPRVRFYTSVAPTLPKTIKTGNIQMGFGFVTAASASFVPTATWTLIDNWICINPNNVPTITTVYVSQNSTLAIGANSVSCDGLYAFGTISSSGGTITATGSSAANAVGGTYNLVWTRDLPPSYVQGVVLGTLNIVVDYAGISPLVKIGCQTFGPYNVNWSFINKGNIYLWEQNSSGVSVSPTVRNLTFSSAFTGTFKSATSPFGSPSIKSVEVYGNISFGASGTYEVNDWIFRGGFGSVYTLTTNGVNLNASTSRNSFTVGKVGDVAVGPTVNITENNVLLGRITVNVGTFNTNNYNMTINSLFVASSEFKAINLGSSTVTLNNPSALMINITGFSPIYGTATLILSGPAAEVNGGNIYNLVIAGAGPAVAGAYVRFYGTTTISNNLSSTITVPYTIYVDPYTVSTYLTVENFNISGTAGNLVNINVFGGVGQGRINMNAQNPTTNYLNISNTRAQSAVNTFGYYFAGYNSVDGGNNINWIFTAPNSSYGVLALF